MFVIFINRILQQVCFLDDFNMLKQDIITAINKAKYYLLNYVENKFTQQNFIS